MDEIAFNLRWILFSVMAFIPLAMSVLTVISLNPVTKLIIAKDGSQFKSSFVKFHNFSCFLWDQRSL